MSLIYEREASVQKMRADPSVRFVMDMFSKHYREAPLIMPDRFSKREFGFMFFNSTMVIRHLGFSREQELNEFLAGQFAKWWLPDRYEFVAEIPKTSVGKFRKTELRDMFAKQEEPA